MVRISGFMNGPYILPIVFVMITSVAVACSAPDAGQEITATATADPPTAAPTPTRTPTPDPATLPTPVMGPYISFTTEPGAGTHQRVYPYGVDQVVAIVKYQDMRDGLIVKQEWRRGGEVLKTREEPWDFARYGAEGTRVDMFLGGETLEPGTYLLELSIDGAPQYATLTWAADFGFKVLEPQEPKEFPSPGDASMVATIGRLGELVVRDCAGCPDRTLVGEAVKDVIWFPDGQHILYTAGSYVEPIEDVHYSSPEFVTSTSVNVIDTASGEGHEVTTRRSIAHVGISPDGRTITLLSGGYSDAGNCGSGLLFFKLGDATQTVDSLSLWEFFSGSIQPGVSDLCPVEQPGLPLPGEWISATVFKTAIAQLGDGTQDGIYLLDMEKLSAQKIADLRP